jgi:hypothetical protein
MLFHLSLSLHMLILELSLARRTLECNLRFGQDCSPLLVQEKSQDNCDAFAAPWLSPPTARLREVACFELAI